MWKMKMLIGALAVGLVTASPLLPAVPGNGSAPPPHAAVWLRFRDLTAQEASWLLQMREEEKLARDLYLDFAEQWELPLFTNIARAEQRHLATMGMMIELFGLIDPIQDDTRGAFSTPAWETLYAELGAQGAVSVEQALLAAGWVEEADILDLMDALEQVTDPALARAFDHLLLGSQRHLRAVVTELGKIGLDYQAQLLAPELLDELLASTEGDPGLSELPGGGRPDWVTPGGGKPDWVVPGGGKPDWAPPGNAFGHGDWR